MGAIQERTVEITNDVQTMSHELHSSKLEYLGIVAAMKGFCREFGEQQGVEIDFRSNDLPMHLSPEISLCLFRVLQEALHNGAKHSGVQHFDVQLREDSGGIHLDINDSGRGFDVNTAMHSQGLGLISMRERVRLVNGTITIESRPKSGTSIHVHVPVASERHRERTAV
jgi:signal transduction histidine kinase